MDRYDVAAVLLCVAVFVAGAASFLPHQGLWVDEATQLRGLALGPVGVTRWLAGADYNLSVPGDRSPPLSYWAGQLWCVFAPLGISSLRWMGVVCVVLAVPAVYLAGRTAFSRATGLAGSLLFALSPNVVVAAVEIRPYPLFLCLSAWSLFCLLRIARSDSASWHTSCAPLAALLIAAAYTHYFGVVLGVCCILALLIQHLARKRSVNPVLALGAVVGASWIGLIPFALAASTLSSRYPALDTPHLAVEPLARLAYRLIGHPAFAVSPASRNLLLAATGLCFALALHAALRKLKASSVLVTMLAAGFATVTVAMPVVPFMTSLPEYNLWMVPPFLLLLASPLASPLPRARIAAASGLACITAASVFAVAQLGLRGPYFAHTRSQHIANVISELPDVDTIIVHDTARDDATGIVYYALRYLLGPRPPQYLAGQLSSDPPGIVLRCFEGEMAPVDAYAAETIVVMRSVSQYTPDIVRQIRSGDDPREPGAIEQYLVDRGYSLNREEVFMSLVRTELAVLVVNPVE